MDFQKLSKQLFFAFIFLLPLQTVYLLREVMVGGEKWQYGSVALYGTDILLLLVAIFFLVIPAKAGIQNPGSRVKPGMTEMMLILFVAWSGFSMFWAPDQMLAGYFFVKLVLAAGVFFLARSLSDEDVKVALRVLIVGAVLESLLGIGQFLMQSTFASTLLGMSAHEVWQAGTSVLKGDAGRWLRAYGTFPHPNMLGGFLSVVLVMGIAYQALQTKISDAGCRISDWKRSFQNPISLISYLLSCIYYPVSLILIILGLILTFSRSAWLGAGMGIAVYYVLRIKYRVWGKWDTRMLLTLGIATAIFVGVLHETVFPRFDSVAIEREGSVSERVQSLRDAKVVMGEGNILLGTGAGNFTSEMMRLQPERPIWTIQPAHNVPVLVFAELGLVGFVLFIAFLFVILAKAGIQVIRAFWIPGQARDDREEGSFEKNQNVIFVIAIVALIPALLLDHYLWTSHFGLLFFFLLLGLASRKSWE